MNEQHRDYIRRTLRSVITRASRTGLTHQTAFVRESTGRRVLMACQCIVMLDCMEVDPVRFAAMLGYQWKPEHGPIKKCSEDYIASVTPPTRGEEQEAE
jgi:hypothetical protein